MSINISDIIEVNISVSPTQIGTDGFGPLMFVTKQFQPKAGEQPVRIYTSKSDVDLDFPTGEIATAATAWYSQTPRPKTFIVAAQVSKGGTSAATSGTLAGTNKANLADLAKITAGSLRLSIDSHSNVQTPAIDFSGANVTFNDVVSTLNSQLNGLAVVSTTDGVFTIKSTSVGSQSLVYLLGETPLSTALQLNASQGAKTTAGVDAQDITSDLAAATNALASAGQNYYYVAVDRSSRGFDSVVAAKWCEAQDKVFGLSTSDAKVLSIGDTSNPFYQAKQANLQRTICVYDASPGGNEYPEISILARASTVNFNVADSSIILAFKQGPGITTANITGGQLAALKSYNGNAFINVGGKVMFYNGIMANGSAWFDTVQGVDWLTSKVQANVFNLFYGAKSKIGWTEGGVAKVNQQVTNALELARTNGLIAPGYDNEGEFYPNGYKVMSTDMALLQSEKGKRIWEGTSFIAIGAGAIQGAVISGNFIQ